MSDRSKNPWLPAAAAAAAAILVGSGIVATRFVIDQTSPASLALLRYAIGFCCLLPATLMAERVRFEPRDILPIGVLGIIQFGILIALLNYGLQYVPSARGSLIFATFPLLTMILAAALRFEPLTLFKTLGVGLTILGVGLALSQKLAASAASGAGWIGELAIFASALSGAACSVFYRPYLVKYAALPVGAFAMLASVLFLAVLAALEGFFAAPPRFSAAGWGAVAFIGVSSGVGYFLWLWALKHTTPTKVTIFLALSPITATALGWLWLSEAVSVPFLLGLASVAGGLWIAHREPAPRPD